MILEFGLKKPAFRIVVNTPTTHGSIGLTTGLDPAMTLGCGGYGGNITSDNISPRHLLNIKRLAYEISPAHNRFERVGTRPGSDPGLTPKLPSVPVRPPAPVGISADALTARISQFLEGRGIRSVAGQATAPPSRAADRTPEPDRRVLDFVSEEDVRLALKAGTKLLVSERAIITPAARDLGEQHRVFSIAPWRG